LGASTCQFCTAALSALSSLQHTAAPITKASSQNVLNMVFRLAIDVGNVILFDGVPPTHACLQTIKEITMKLGATNTFVVSYCFKNRQIATLERLVRYQFFDITGILPRNVIFCTSRDSKEDENKPLAIGDLRHVKNSHIQGPLYAPPKYGKGALGRLLNLHGLVDDKIANLEDFKTYSRHQQCDLILIQALLAGQTAARPSSDNVVTVHTKWLDIEQAILDFIPKPKKQPRPASTSFANNDGRGAVSVSNNVNEVLPMTREIFIQRHGKDKTFHVGSSTSFDNTDGMGVVSVTNNVTEVLPMTRELFIQRHGKYKAPRLQ